MPHDTSLLSTIAVGLSLALVGGLIAARLRLSPLVGYLLAGVAVGPFTPGFVADTGLAQQLAEIGVIFLMFGVGMHFSVGDLWAVRKIAVPGAIVQMAVATGLGIGLAQLWGWPLSTGLIFGLALSVASTVVLLRAFRDGDALYSENGRIAVGWLIVEDLAMVLVLVLLPVLAGASRESGSLLSSVLPETGSLAASLAITVLEVAALIVFMLVVGRRLFPRLLKYINDGGSRELFTLAVVVMAIGVAYGSAKLFGVSLALGAFFAGIVVKESEVNQRVARKLRPLEDLFTVLFFVSMGMLFDPAILLREPLAVLAALAIVMIGKSVAALLIVLALGRPLHTALTVSAGLAQIGEFSFILGGMAVALKLLPVEGFNLIIAAALLSVILNPLMFRLADGLKR